MLAALRRAGRGRSCRLLFFFPSTCGLASLVARFARRPAARALRRRRLDMCLSRVALQLGSVKKVHRCWSGCIRSIAMCAQKRAERLARLSRLHILATSPKCAVCMRVLVCPNARTPSHPACARLMRVAHRVCRHALWIDTASLAGASVFPIAACSRGRHARAVRSTTGLVRCARQPAACPATDALIARAKKRCCASRLARSLGRR